MPVVLRDRRQTLVLQEVLAGQRDGAETQPDERHVAGVALLAQGGLLGGVCEPQRVVARSRRQLRHAQQVEPDPAWPRRPAGDLRAEQRVALEERGTHGADAAVSAPAVRDEDARLLGDVLQFAAEDACVREAGPGCFSLSLGLRLGRVEDGAPHHRVHGLIHQRPRGPQVQLLDVQEHHSFEAFKEPGCTVLSGKSRAREVRRVEVEVSSEQVDLASSGGRDDGARSVAQPPCEGEAREGEGHPFGRPLRGLVRTHTALHHRQRRRHLRNCRPPRLGAVQVCVEPTFVACVCFSFACDPANVALEAAAVSAREPCQGVWMGRDGLGGMSERRHGDGRSSRWGCCCRSCPLRRRSDLLSSHGAMLVRVESALIACPGRAIAVATAIVALERAAVATRVPCERMIVIDRLHFSTPARFSKATWMRVHAACFTREGRAGIAAFAAQVAGVGAIGPVATSEEDERMSVGSDDRARLRDTVRDIVRGSWRRRSTGRLARCFCFRFWRWSSAHNNDVDRWRCFGC